MERVKVFVCCHKPCNVPQERVLVPLHVGRAISPCKENMSEMLGDDTGDNISEKNLHYSEGTGLYWIWKNVHDAEYVGLCHYRRFFDIPFSSIDIHDYLNGKDVILVEKSLRTFTRWNNMMQFVAFEDASIMVDCIKKICPEYLTSVYQYANSFYAIDYNMLICKKEIFDRYAEWVFSICFEMEKYIRYSPYKNSARVFGYIIEFLTPIYFLHNNHQIKIAPLKFEDKSQKVSFYYNSVIWFLQHTAYLKIKNRPIYISDSVRSGLEEMGIVVK